MLLCDYTLIAVADIVWWVFVCIYDCILSCARYSRNRGDSRGESSASLALPDPFFFYMGTGKKGLVNSLYHFCSADPEFLRVVDWPLIATKVCILVIIRHKVEAMLG